MNNNLKKFLPLIIAITIATNAWGMERIRSFFSNFWSRTPPAAAPATPPAEQMPEREPDTPPVSAAAPNQISLDQLPGELNIKIMQSAILDQAAQGDYKTALKTLANLRATSKTFRQLGTDKPFLLQLFNYIPDLHKRIPQFKDYLFHPSEEKLTQKVTILGQEFTLEQIMLACRILNFCDCRLTAIPAGLGNCHNLKILNLDLNDFRSHAAIESLSTVLAQLPLLESLDLRDCNLTSDQIATLRRPGLRIIS